MDVVVDGVVLRFGDQRQQHRRDRTDRPLSYAEALPRAGCTETIEATVRKRRLLFGGLVVRMEDERLPKLVLLGETERGKRSVGGQEHCWMRRLEEDLVAFNVADEKKRGAWKTSAQDPEEWYTKVEDGAGWFMRRWHRDHSEDSEKRQADRGEKDGDARQPKVRKERSLVAPDGRRSSRKRTGRGGETARAEIQKFEAERVARLLYCCCCLGPPCFPVPPA